jgi:hypothetical protein
MGLVSYAMTHHPRQSVLGLPFIKKKVYGGVKYSVSAYTMAEIIASVYDMMERTDLSEGIGVSGRNQLYVRNPCPGYTAVFAVQDLRMASGSELLFYEQQKEIIRELEKIELEN